MTQKNNDDIANLERGQYELSAALQALQRDPDSKKTLSVMERFFGPKENAALYVAAGIIISCFVFLGLTAWLDSGLRLEIIKIIGAVFLAAVGFVGGLLAAK